MKRIETEIWEPAKENPRKLNYTGQRTAQEVFYDLKERLESTGYLPDEYFLMNGVWDDGKEIPKGADIFCTTDYGASEGIYIDIYLKWYDDNKREYITTNFATGKTLGETESDLDRMFLISSAVTKAFHSDGEHARYLKTGGTEEAGNLIMHLTADEQRVLIDSLVDKRSILKSETQAVEQLLRRITGSITGFINEVGEYPLKTSDYDMAVLAIQDGNLAALEDTYLKTPDKLGELLIQAAGRPGNVGKRMTELILDAAREIPNDMYLEACKKALATGDRERVLLMTGEAANRVDDLDMSLFGKLISESLYQHRSHIGYTIADKCLSEQIKSAPPELLPQALRQEDYRIALKLVENGIDANRCAADVVFALRYKGNNQGFYKHLVERGMQVDNENYSTMQACIKTNSVEIGKILLDYGMDFDRYQEWAEGEEYVETDGETFSVIKEYWENEVNQQEQETSPAMSM